MKRKGIREIMFAVVFLAAAVLMIVKPCPGLEGMGHYAMGFTIITVAGWIFRPFGVPNSICGIFLLGAMLIFGMSTDTVFSGFSQNALWTLIPALFLGYALQKTGLGERIATGVLRIFPSNWAAVTCAWVLIGTALSLVTPSMTVRAVIMIPVAQQCCRLYGLKQGSRESAYMILITLFTSIFPGNAFLIGNLTAQIILGVFETTPGLTGTITFDTWLQAALLPVAIITVLSVILGYLFLKPSQKLSREQFRSNTAAQKRISSHELITAIVLAVSCILFFTGRYHGISSTAICIMAAVILFAAGVIRAGEFATGISWDLVFFFGAALSMSSIFQASGLSDWLAEMISPVVMSIAGNPFLFILIITVVLFIWRFVDVTTLIPTMIILAPVVSRLSADMGISPAVWGTIFAVASISMFLTYTNMWTVMGKGMVKEYAWQEGQLFRFGLAFFLASLAGFLITVPYWMSKGLL